MKRLTFVLASSFVSAALLGLACGEDSALVRARLDGGEGSADARPDGTLACGVQVPTSFASASFASNAAVELALAASLGQLATKMRAAELTDAGAGGAELKALYNGGTPSLRAVSTTGAQLAVDGNLDAWEAAQAKSWSPSAALQDGGLSAGGQYGSAYVSAVGLHLRAHTSATLLGGALLNRVLGLVAAPVTEATVDSMLAAFGATPSSLDTSDAGGASELLADYAQRLSMRASAPGPYERMRATLLTLKAAAVAGDKCKDERDAAVRGFLAEWERISFAVAIGHLASAATLAANPEKGSEALRALAISVGFVGAFKGLPAAKRQVTDAQIDALLSKIGADSPYKLVTSPGESSLKLNDAISDIALYEGFTAADVEAYRKAF